MAVTVTQDRTPTEMMTRMGAGWCLNGSKWPQISPLPYLLHADNTGFSKEATTKEAVRHSKGSLNIPAQEESKHKQWSIRPVTT